MRRAKLKFSLSKKAALWIIALSTLLVVISVFLWFYLRPEKIAERELEYLSKDYYETYYYPKLVSQKDKSNLENFAENGLPNVKLRQLLLFDAERHAISEKAFDQEKYVCNTELTYIKYYPVEPFGEKDYRVEYFYSCNDR